MGQEYTHKLIIQTTNDDTVVLGSHRPGQAVADVAAELATRLTKGAGLYGQIEDDCWAVVPGASIAYVHIEEIQAAPTYQPSHADEGSGAVDPSSSTDQTPSTPDPSVVELPAQPATDAPQVVPPQTAA